MKMTIKRHYKNDRKKERPYEKRRPYKNDYKKKDTMKKEPIKMTIKRKKWL